jgi:hypothetical protein
MSALASTPGGEIDFGPFSAVGAGGGGGGGEGGLQGSGGASFARGTLGGKGFTKREALQEVQQQLLLRGQSSDVSSTIQIPEVRCGR